MALAQSSMSLTARPALMPRPSAVRSVARSRVVTVKALSDVNLIVGGAHGARGAPI
jgi:hypothetical protein